MKPLETTSITNSNINSDFEFTIKASKHAFKILSDSLYSNKIKAVVREYLTNALDAHIASKREIPFIITEPSENILEGTRYWEVRDFGSGLSKEDIKKYYCTYFSSSKQESNDFTGMLGLGCKSAFAYTQQFSVTSWFNGEKIEYLLFIDNGLPQITEIYSEPSNEPSGIKVSIPVKELDVNSFKDYTYEITNFFPKQYLEEKYHSSDKIVYEDDNCIVVKGKSTSYYVSVIMGHVLYNIYLNCPDELHISRPLINYIQSSGYVVYLKAPTGSISILPSREGLSFDTYTIKYIQKLHKKVEQTFKVKYQSICKNKKHFDMVDDFIDDLNIKPNAFKSKQFKTLFFKQDVRAFNSNSHYTEIMYWQGLNSFIYAGRSKQKHRVIGVFSDKNIQKGVKNFKEYCGKNNVLGSFFVYKNKLDKKKLLKEISKVWSGIIYQDWNKMFEHLGIKVYKSKPKSNNTKLYKLYEYDLNNLSKITEIFLTKREIKKLSETNLIFHSKTLPNIIRDFPEHFGLNKSVYILEPNEIKASALNFKSAQLDIDLMKTNILANSLKDTWISIFCNLLDSGFISIKFDYWYTDVRNTKLQKFCINKLYSLIDTFSTIEMKESFPKVLEVYTKFIENLFINAKREYIYALIGSRKATFRVTVAELLSLTEIELFIKIEEYVCQLPSLDLQ